VSAEGAVRWIARLEEAEPWFVSAHPGEGRDPDRMAERVGRGALIDLQPYAPYDLGPGIRRDERKREGERGMLQAPPAPTVWIARHADAARWPLPPPEPADLADAALAKRDGGAGRLLRRRMLRALVARAYAIHPAAVRFTRDARGAPGLEGLPAFISAAGCMADGEAWSAVALSPSPIGVDLEPGPATEALSHWTLTEAYLKALGRGLAVPPEQVRVGRDGGGWRLGLDGALGGKGELCPSPAFAVAVALLTRETALAET
jgi:hypothetical protein